MEDHLDVDPVISNQKYVCLSVLTPNSIKNPEGEVVEGFTARGIKVRGCYATLEEAQKRCEQIRQFDKVFNVYVGEVGTWLPWEDDVEKAEEAVYAEEKLNQMMKAFKEQQIKAKEYQEYRRQMEMEKAIKEAQKIKKSDEDSEENVDKNVIEEIETSITNEKKGLSEYKSEIINKEKEISDISSELEKARKLFEELTKNVNK